MTALGLLLCSFCGLVFSLVLILLGVIIGVVFKLPQKGGLDVERKELVVKLVFYMSFAGAIFMVSSILGFLSFLLWWIGVEVLILNTPKKLAWGSVIFGCFPLFISALSAVIAKSIGCSLHQGRHKNFKVFGLNVGRVLYGMYVSAWLTIFTSGIAFFGLIAALVWQWMR